MVITDPILAELLVRDLPRGLVGTLTRNGVQRQVAATDADDLKLDGCVSCCESVAVVRHDVIVPDAARP